MGNDKLVLTDGTEIMLEASPGTGTLNVLVKNRAAVCTLWEKFTKKNLESVEIRNAEGELLGNYHDMVLDHITGKDNTDGSVLVTFSLRDKTREEILEERIAALEKGQKVLEEGQQTQDEAISDLGQTVSDVVMEGGIQ